MIDDKIKDISNKITKKAMGSSGDDDEESDEVVERGDGDLRNKLRETGGEIRVEKSQIPDLMAFLSSERVEDRVNASRALVEVAQHYPDEVEEHIQDVVGLLDDEDNKVRKHSCITLGVVGSEEAIDDLEDVMEGADEEVKIAAEKAIRHIRKQHSGEVETVTDDQGQPSEETTGGPETAEVAEAGDEPSDGGTEADDDRPAWAGGSDDGDGEEGEEDTTDAVDAEGIEAEDADEEKVDEIVGESVADDATADTDEATEQQADDLAEADDDRPAWAGGSETEEESVDETAETSEEAIDTDETPSEAAESAEGPGPAEASESEPDDETDEIKEVPAGDSGMDDESSTGTADVTEAEGDARHEIRASVDEALEDLDRPVTELPSLVLLQLLGEEGSEDVREEVRETIDGLVEEYPDKLGDAAPDFVDAMSDERESVSRFASDVVESITEQRPEALEDEIPHLMDSVRSADEDIRGRAKDALTRIAERSPDRLVDELAEREE